MPIAKMMGRMGKMAGKGATAIMKDRAAPAKASGLGRLMDVVRTAKSEQDAKPKTGPMMVDKPAGRGRFGRMIGAAVNAAPKAMKKGGMADKTGRAMKKTTADAKGRAMKKGK